MQVLSACVAVFAAGCFGGFVNALIAGELYLPRVNRRLRVWRPGWIGNVIVGGTAAIVFWGLYGPVAGAQIVGPESDLRVVLRVSELFGSVLSGVGGGRLLSAEMERRLLRTVFNETRANMSAAVKNLAKTQEELSEDEQA